MVCFKAFTSPVYFSKRLRNAAETRKPKRPHLRCLGHHQGHRLAGLCLRKQLPPVEWRHKFWSLRRIACHRKWTPETRVHFFELSPMIQKTEIHSKCQPLWGIQGESVPWGNQQMPNVWWIALMSQNRGTSGFPEIRPSWLDPEIPVQGSTGSPVGQGLIREASRSSGRPFNPTLDGQNPGLTSWQAGKVLGPNCKQISVAFLPNPDFSQPCQTKKKLHKLPPAKKGDTQKQTTRCCYSHTPRPTPQPPNLPSPNPSPPPTNPPPPPLSSLPALPWPPAPSRPPAPPPPPPWPWRPPGSADQTDARNHRAEARREAPSAFFFVPQDPRGWVQRTGFWGVPWRNPLGGFFLKIGDRPVRHTQPRICVGPEELGEFSEKLGCCQEIPWGISLVLR